MQKKQQLLIVFGPPASGKMTVGKKLAKRLNYRLFHDHQVIELVRKYYDVNDHPFWPLMSKLRRTIFEEVAGSYLEGFILTFIWDLNSEDDREYIDQIVELFENNLWQVRFVELQAKLGTRLRRSKNPDRYDEKPLKADLEKVESEIMEYEDYITNTTEDFAPPNQFLKVETTKMTVEEVAEQIITHFELKDLPEQKFEFSKE